MSVMWERPYLFPLTPNLTGVGHLEKKLHFPQGRTTTAKSQMGRGTLAK